MAALSDADRRRALMRAAKKYELCRMIGDGNVRSGLFRMAVAERRASSAVDATATPAKAGAVEACKPRQLPLTSPRWTWRQLLMLLQARRGARCVEGAHGSGSASGKRTRKRLLLLHLQPGFHWLEGQLTAPQVALPVWRWARGVQGRVSGHCRRRPWRMAAPTDLRWRAAAAQ